MPQRLEVGEDSLEIKDSFRYFGEVISCGVGVESAVSDRISGAWSKWRELVSLLVNHSIYFRSQMFATIKCLPISTIAIPVFSNLAKG